jgi:protein subunit release factor B
MDPVSTEKWHILRERMAVLGIYEDDIQESFTLGGGPGGQKVNNTHSVVRLRYNDHTIRVKTSRHREVNRYMARKHLCDAVSRALGISVKQDTVIQKAIKQKKRRQRRHRSAMGRVPDVL